METKLAIAGMILAWVAAGVSYACWRLTERSRRFRMGDASKEIQAEITHHITTSVGATLELMERMLTDLEFLHSEVFKKDRLHVCPICKTTIPRLKTLVEELRMVKVSVDVEPRGNAGC